MAFLPVEDQLEIIQRGATEIVPLDELKEKLKKSAKENNPLQIKLGVDPTRPDLHLGHSVVLRKMRQFQDLGHEAILIIGGFTAMIGDPTGQNTTRPPLTAEEVAENAQSYIDQAQKILDTSRLKIVNNNDWLGTMSFMDVIRLASKTTVARMIERDDFSKRFNNNEPISLHEFLYPLAQGQDSVYLENDVELGGTDQKFNLLVGRQLQKDNDIEPQVCLMMPLLVGTDGSAKMSKSYDNYVGLEDDPATMYGRLMSIPDELMPSYLELLTNHDLPGIQFQLDKIKDRPMEVKRDLAFHITAIYHGDKGAMLGALTFDNVVRNKQVPDDAPEHKVKADDPVRLLEIISDLNFSSSNGETKRLIQQGGVSIDDEKVSDIGLEISLSSGEEKVLKVGKRKYAILKGA